MSIPPSQVDDAAQHILDGTIDPLKQHLSSSPSDTLIVLDGSLVQQGMVGDDVTRVEGGDMLMTTTVSVVQEPIIPQIVGHKQEEKKGEKGGGKKAPGRRGRPKRSLDDDKSGGGDDTIIHIHTGPNGIYSFSFFLLFLLVFI